MSLNSQPKDIIYFPRQFSIWTDTHFVLQLHHLFVPLLFAGTLVVGRKAETKSNGNFLFTGLFAHICYNFELSLQNWATVIYRLKDLLKISEKNMIAVEKLSLLSHAGNISQQCITFFLLPWLTGLPEFALFGLLYFDIIFLSFVSCTSCSSTGWFLFISENSQS